MLGIKIYVLKPCYYTFPFKMFIRCFKQHFNKIVQFLLLSIQKHFLFKICLFEIADVKTYTETLFILKGLTPLLSDILVAIYYVLSLFVLSAISYSSCTFQGRFKVIPFNCIAHPFCASFFAWLARARARSRSNSIGFLWKLSCSEKWMVIFS